MGFRISGLGLRIQDLGYRYILLCFVARLGLCVAVNAVPNTQFSRALEVSKRSLRGFQGSSLGIAQVQGLGFTV